MEINVIYNEDCIVGMQSIPSDCIDLIVTSPPYNIGIEYDSYNDKLDWDEYYNWCGDWMKEIYRILKPDGKLCLNHYLSFGKAEQRLSPIMDLNTQAKDIGFKHHAIVLWMDEHRIKYTAWGSWLSASAPYINCPVEGILILYKNRWKKDKKGISTISKEEFIEACSGVWRIRPEMKGYTKANFPVELPKRCINLLTYKNDIVLDPFMGAGTTAIAAIETGRNYIGFEISSNYCKIAKRRINNIISQTKLEVQ